MEKVNLIDQIKIIFEDENILAINKPAGLIVHPDKIEFIDNSVWLWLSEKYPNLEKIGEKINLGKNEEIFLPRFGIAHRLDTETSGALLIAKNNQVFDDLKKQFQNHSIKKIYQAFCFEWPKEEKGTIDVPIGRSPKDFRRWSAQRGARGVLRESVTDWKCLFRFKEKDNRFCFVEFYPKTGRTHQIRVHAKFMHHPIVSDSLYAGKRSKALGFKRQALHARQITFSIIGQEKTILADYPFDFGLALEKYCTMC